MFERALVVVSPAAFLNKSIFFIKLACSRIGFPDLQDQRPGACGCCPTDHVPHQRQSDTSTSHRLIDYHAFDLPFVGNTERNQKSNDRFIAKLLCRDQDCAWRHIGQEECFVLLYAPVRGLCSLPLEMQHLRNIGKNC